MTNNLDTFFYYGTGRGNIEKEIKDDIRAGISQRKRSIYYNRQYGADINRRENYPNTFILVLMTRYDVINWITYRNTVLPAQEGSLNDRRVAVSQNTINFMQNKSGGVDIDVSYIPFSASQKSQSIQLPVGVN